MPRRETQCRVLPEARHCSPCSLSRGAPATTFGFDQDPDDSIDDYTQREGALFFITTPEEEIKAVCYDLASGGSADLAEPHGMFDVADIAAFIAGFAIGCR